MRLNAKLSIRDDSNDVFAMYNATKEVHHRALADNQLFLIGSNKIVKKKHILLHCSLYKTIKKL